MAWRRLGVRWQSAYAAWNHPRFVRAKAACRSLRGDTNGPLRLPVTLKSPENVRRSSSAAGQSAGKRRLRAFGGALGEARPNNVGQDFGTCLSGTVSRVTLESERSHHSDPPNVRKRLTDRKSFASAGQVAHRVFAYPIVVGGCPVNSMISSANRVACFSSSAVSFSSVCLRSATSSSKMPGLFSLIWQSS